MRHSRVGDAKKNFWFAKFSRDSIADTLALAALAVLWLIGRPIFAAPVAAVVAFGIWHIGLLGTTGILLFLLLLPSFIMVSGSNTSSWSTEELLGLYLFYVLLILSFSMLILLLLWLISTGTFLSVGIAIVIFLVLITLFSVP